MELEIGKKFSSYEELTTFLSAYEKQEQQKFWKRSSRTLKGVRLTKQFNRRIQYYEIHYSCIHGGVNFKTKGRGIKRVRTLRMSCPANIKLRASSDGESLEIRSFINEHRYHELSKAIQQRIVRKTPISEQGNKDEGEDKDGISTTDDETNPFLVHPPTYETISIPKSGIQAMQVEYVSCGNTEETDTAITKNISENSAETPVSTKRKKDTPPQKIAASNQQADILTAVKICATNNEEDILTTVKICATNNEEDILTTASTNQEDILTAVDKQNEVPQLASRERQDMYSNFGCYVASALRATGGQRAIIMQHEISNVLFKHMSGLSPYPTVPSNESSGLGPESPNELSSHGSIDEQGVREEIKNEQIDDWQSVINTETIEL